ncbi:hypothetical protein [Flexivirga meconopsidis]|uniref:hypothetical protein n=1 Tax=Flexivirga meconopsidis TaxID=2977121 RepID=UPI002240192F|nr:hypothetical protein [Flexivirga meconopsidis]
MITHPQPRPEDVRRVADLAHAAGGTPAIITIDGRSGSGKTTFAAALAAELGDATVVHLDDLYPGWDGLAATPKIVAAWLMTPLRAGRAASYRRFDWATGDYADEVTVPTATFVIIEGAGSSVEPAGGHADVRVWLEAARSTRKARGLARDGDAYAPYWQRWADQEDAVFGADGTRERAEVVIATD